MGYLITKYTIVLGKYQDLFLVHDGPTTILAIQIFQIITHESKFTFSLEAKNAANSQ